MKKIDFIQHNSIGEFLDKFKLVIKIADHDYINSLIKLCIEKDDYELQKLINMGMYEEMSVAIDNYVIKAKKNEDFEKELKELNDEYLSLLIILREMSIINESIFDKSSGISVVDRDSISIEYVNKLN